MKKKIGVSALALSMMLAVASPSYADETGNNNNAETSKVLEQKIKIKRQKTTSQNSAGTEQNDYVRKMKTRNGKNSSGETVSIITEDGIDSELFEFRHVGKGRINRFNISSSGTENFKSFDKFDAATENGEFEFPGFNLEIDGERPPMIQRGFDFSAYEEFGLTFDKENHLMSYNGKSVKLFLEGNGKIILNQEGEVNIKAVYDDDGRLSGIAEMSDSEYTETITEFEERRAEMEGKMEEWRNNTFDETEENSLKSFKSKTKTKKQENLTAVDTTV